MVGLLCIQAFVPKPSRSKPPKTLRRLQGQQSMVKYSNLLCRGITSKGEAPRPP